MSEEPNNFELVFEGPVDDSPDTMRKLRASLLADAGLNVEQALEALKNNPTTIMRAEQEEALLPALNAIKKAGGKVLLVNHSKISEEETPGYFLDLESSALSAELIASLENLQGESEAVEIDNQKAYVLEIQEDIPSIQIPTQLTKTTGDNQGSNNSKQLDLTLCSSESTSIQVPLPVPNTATSTDSQNSTIEFKLEPLEGPKELLGTKVNKTPDASTISSKSEMFDLAIAIAEDETQSIEPLAQQISTEDFSKNQLSESLAISISEEKNQQKSQPRATSQNETKLVFETPEKPTALDASQSKPELKWAIPATHTNVDSATKQAISPPPTSEVVVVHNAASSSYSNKLKKSSNILIPILLGSILLGIANWIYFGSQKQRSISFNFNFSEEEDSSINTLQQERERLKKQKTILKSSQKSTEYQLQWWLTFDKDKLTSVSIEIVTPKPPEPTSHEIVHNIKPQAWLRKVDATELPITNTVAGKFEIKSQARLFIEEGKMKRRIPATIEVEIDQSASAQAAQINVLIYRGIDVTKTDQNFVFESLPNGDYNFLFRTELSHNSN